MRRSKRLEKEVAELHIMLHETMEALIEIGAAVLELREEKDQI